MVLIYSGCKLVPNYNPSLYITNNQEEKEIEKKEKEGGARPGWVVRMVVYVMARRH